MIRGIQFLFASQSHGGGAFFVYGKLHQAADAFVIRQSKNCFLGHSHYLVLIHHAKWKTKLITVHDGAENKTKTGFPDGLLAALLQFIL